MILNLQALGVAMSIMIAISVGPTAGYLGSIMVSRRMALVGDALSHVALPGLALGLLLDFNPFLGAFAFLVAAMLATWYIQRSSVLPTETIVGVLFVLALAVGILITPEPDLLEALFGDISNVTPLDTLITMVVAAATALITRLIYGKIVLSMISKDIAVSSGVNVESINLVYLILVATIVAIGIREVGTLLVGAVVIVPAAAARNVSMSIRSYSILSSLFGGISAVAGVVAAILFNIPAGPLVVIAGVVIFVFSYIFGRSQSG